MSPDGQNNATSPSAPSLDRELSISELYTRTFELTRRNYLKVLPIFVAFGIISTILSSLITYATPSFSLTSNVSSVTSSQISTVLVTGFEDIGYTLANYFVSWNILYFAAGLGIWRINQSFGNTLQPRVKPNYANLAIATILSVLIIEAGLFLVLVGALIFAIMLYLVLAAVVIENKRATEAIGRSRQLNSGRWIKTLVLLAGIQIVIFIVSSFVGAIVSLPFSGALSTIVGAVATNFVIALAFPLVSASMLILYYSNKVGETTIFKGPPSPYSNMKPEPLPGFPTLRNDSCPKCGSSVTREEKFCHNCGTQLQS